MNHLNVFTALVGTGAILAILSMIRPAWPLLSIAVFLVCVALLVK